MMERRTGYLTATCTVGLFDARQERQVQELKQRDIQQMQEGLRRILLAALEAQPGPVVVWRSDLPVETRNDDTCGEETITLRYGIALVDPMRAEVGDAIWLDHDTSQRYAIGETFQVNRSQFTREDTYIGRRIA